jgi:hypothetical protein
VGRWGESFFELRQRENCKRTARRFGERLFLLVSLPPFWINARESEVSFGELLPHFWFCPPGQNLEAGEQFPQSLWTLLSWIQERRQGGKEERQFRSSPNLLAVLLQFSLCRCSKKPRSPDAADRRELRATMKPTSHPDTH